MELSLSEAILRLFLALLLGSVVGLEREVSQQSAGLRTHILVCLGATAFTIVSISDMSQGLSQLDPALGVDYRIVRDPARIAAQVVTGIGFIGGGAVLRHGASIRGLTTAASLWMMASIGMLTGIGQYYLAIVATLFSFLVLFTIGTLEHFVFQKHMKKYSRMRLNVSIKESKLPEIQAWVERHLGKEVMEMKTSHHDETDTISLSYVLDVRGLQVDVNDLSQQLNGLKGVLSSSLKIYHEE